MGSGLIYLIIIGMWIAYFLPRWISNYEEISGKTVKRFDEAMKAVGITSGHTALALESVNRKREEQLATRRIQFFSIIGLAIVISLFTLVGLLSPIILLLPGSVFAMYVVNARYRIGLVQEEVKRINAASRVTHRSSSASYAEIIGRSKRAASFASITQGSGLSEEQWLPLSDRVSHSQEAGSITLLPKGSAASDDKSWDPVAVPAPNYASSSKAVPRRVIDLTIPGAWSEAQEKIMREALAPSADKIFDQEIADQYGEQLRSNRAAGQ
ncbi:MAG: hypothetical protein FJW91_02160 [Actinobacteria bacterium]|nr:hypothetical protein [Actinomycetota bacterium]